MQKPRAIDRGLAIVVIGLKPKSYGAGIIVVNSVRRPPAAFVVGVR